jgi:hypothetical protein
MGGERWMKILRGTSVLVVLSAFALSCGEAAPTDVLEATTAACPHELRFDGTERLSIQHGVPDWPQDTFHYDEDATVEDEEEIRIIVEELSRYECVAFEGAVEDLPAPDHLVMFPSGENVLATLAYYEDAIRLGDGDTESRWLTQLGQPAFYLTTVELPEHATE